MTHTQGKGEIKNRLSQIILFAFLLSVFGPLELYFSNKGYFFFEGTELFPGALAVCLVLAFVSAIVLLITYKLSDKFYRVISGMFFGGTLALYIQGNWDTTDYGAWNGSEIDWSQFKIQGVIFALIFVALIVACGLWSLCKREMFDKVANYISCFVLAILVFTLSVLWISYGGLAKNKEFIATTEDELKLSNKENMLILVLDAYDSSAFSELIQREEYKDLFEDFTYYPDTVAAYSSTDMSVPLIITGSDYKNDMLFGDYLDKAYEDSVLINWLDEHGWEKDVYFSGLLPQGKDGFAINNSKLLKRVVSDRKELMRYIYSMVIFRYFPQPIKNRFVFYADNIRGNLCVTQGEYQPYSSDNFELYDRIDDINANKDQSVFQYIHIDGSHEPFEFTENFEKSDVETSYVQECEGCLKITKKFIETLKEQGTYDNSIIYIMADHGYYEDRQNPLLLIKGKNEHHEFNVSEASVSYYDLQEAYIDLLEGSEDGTTVFSKNATSEARERVFRYVPWNTHLNFDTYSGGMGEAFWKGPAYDMNSRESSPVRYEGPEIKGIK